MAARVCEPCLVNWPSISRFQSCPICGEDTKSVYIKNPDFTEAEAVKHAREVKARLEEAQARANGASPAHANRVDRYLALGFSEVDAQVLALATRVHVDSSGRRWVRPVNHLDVAAALASGCSHVLAVEIFS